MAKAAATIFVLLMVVMHSEASILSPLDRRTGFGCFSKRAAEYNRKEVMMKGKGRVKEEQRVVNGDELKRVPSGPDPLHHNGGTPKKPRRNSP